VSPIWVEFDEAARLVRLSRLPFVSSFNLTLVAFCGSLLSSCCQVRRGQGPEFESFNLHSRPCHLPIASPQVPG